MRPSLAVYLPLALLAACAGTQDDATDDDTTDQGGSDETDPAPDTDPGVDTDVPADTDTDLPPDTDVPPPTSPIAVLDSSTLTAQLGSGTLTGSVADTDDALATLTVTLGSSLDGALAAPTLDAVGAFSVDLSAWTPGVHTVTLTVTDPATQSSTATSTVRINRPPTLDAVTIVTTEPRAGSTVSTSAPVAADPDGDSLSTSWAWLADGVEVTTGQGATLPGGHKGKSLVARVTVDDGFGGTATVDAPVVTILNAPPVLQVSIGTGFRTNDTIVITNLTATDPDDDTLNTDWTWAVNGTVVASKPTSALDGRTSFDKGDTVRLAAQVTDGEVIVDAEDSTTILDTPPDIAAVAILPAFGPVWPSESAVCDVDVVDDDGDPLPTPQITWSAGPTGSALPLWNAIGMTTVYPGDTRMIGSLTWGDDVSCAAELPDGPQGVADAAPVRRPWVDVEAGLDRLWCGIDDEGELACAGDDPFGMIADIPTGGDWGALSIGYATGCVIDETAGSERVVCWGGTSTIVDFAPEGAFTDVQTTDTVACAVGPTEDLSCWGNFLVAIQADAPTLSGATDVTVGQSHACAIDSAGGVVCWGDNVWDQLDVPDSNSGWVDIGAFGNGTCGLRGDGSVACWGFPPFGLDTPPSGSDYTRLWLNDGVGCVIDGDGDGTCWGNDALSPLSTIADVPDIVDVAPSASGPCVLQASGGVVCWGEDGYDRVSDLR